MWGKAEDGEGNKTEDGITPTHVGKREVEAIVKSAAEDHPHPCGEKTDGGYSHDVFPGSPPPMWGKVAVMEIFCV